MSFQAGQSYHHTFVVTDQDMQDFASLSGDKNALHMDDDYARKNGFEGRVVYGALLTARLSALIGMKLPAQNVMWLYNSIKFKKPVYIGDRVDIEARVKSYSDSVQTAELEIIMQTRGENLCSGKIGVKVLG